MAQTSPEPMNVEVESAENIYLYGPGNKQYIDLISGISVSNLGHNHPEVIKAIKEQLSRHMHLMVYGEFIQSPQVRLAEALTKTLPNVLDNVFFVNSGSEAVEGALKLAKRYTGRHEIVACKNAYHGATHGALSLSDSAYFKQSFLPLLPGIQHITFGIAQELDQITERTAAFIVETVQGEAGVRVANTEYFKNVRKRCDETGTLLILDEIQTGFGRTGKFWGFEHYDIVPDIVVCAKGMGGGMPLGAFIAPQQIMQTLQSNPVLGHISTFGGHPVCCAASLATQDILLRERWFEQAEAKGQLFVNLLSHPKIKEIRQIGLMLAVDFGDAKFVRKVIGQCTSTGLITDWFLFCDHAIRIAPPLIISEEQIHEACRILIEAIDAV